MDSSVSPKDEIWFLRVCHHISNAVYKLLGISPVARSLAFTNSSLDTALLRHVRTADAKVSAHTFFTCEGVNCERACVYCLREEVLGTSLFTHY